MSPLRGSRFWVRGSQGSQSFALGLTLAAASRLVEEFHSSCCRLEFHSWIFLPAALSPFPEIHGEGVVSM